MTIPATSSVMINDLIPNVQLLLQNRTDLAQYNPAFFMKAAIQEMSMNRDFEELRVTGPQVQLTVGQYLYPVTFWMNPGDDYTTVYALNLFVDYPQNQVSYPLHYETPAGIRPMTFIQQGLPSRWSRFGPNIWLGISPNQPYTTFADYQIRHPFLAGSNLGNTIVRMPAEWHRAVEYSTAYRMAAGPLRWPDMAQELHAMLYGDPDNPNKVGIVSQLVTQMQLDEKIHSRRINVVVSRYQ